MKISNTNQKQRNKHAYCIIAHDDVYTLNSLIKCIDYELNDIYILIDRKSHLIKEEIESPNKSNIVIINPLNIYWGDISQIVAEITVFKEAIKGGNYAYFHLISGLDLPLKSQEYIHSFCNQVKKGTNFLGIAHGLYSENLIKSRVSYYVPFTKYYRDKNKIKAYLLKIVRFCFTSTQRILKIKRRHDIQTFKMGPNWASLTQEFVKYIITNEQQILKTYRGTFCCDELYKQTLAWNSKFVHTIFDIQDPYRSCMREIDWIRGCPYTYDSNDINMLNNSDKFFARKFNSLKDNKIIDFLRTK